MHTAWFAVNVVRAELLLRALSSHRTAGQGPVREKCPVDVSRPVAARGRTIGAFELDDGLRQTRLVLLHGASILQDSELVSVGYWTSRSTGKHQEELLGTHIIICN